MRELFELEKFEITPIEIGGNGISGNGIEYAKEEDFNTFLENLNF